MRQLQMIANNPYRILGVYAGMPKVIETRNLNSIRAFAKVGKAVDFPLKGDNVLPTLSRTQQMAEEAVQKLSLPNDRLNSALIWYSDGNTEWGETLNNAVTAIIKEDYKTAIANYERLISNLNLRTHFLQATTFGLLTLPQEELAKRISKIIITCITDFEVLWSSEGDMPCGMIAQMVYEHAVDTCVEKKLQKVNYMPNLTVDLVTLIPEFKEAIDNIIPICKVCEKIYGTDDPRYRNLVEKILQKVIGKGAFLIRKTGELIWIQRSINKNHDGSYKKHLSKMPVGCIKACMGLITQIDGILNETMLKLNVDNLSRSILYPELHNYEVTKSIEYVEDDTTIRRSLTPFYIIRGITIAVWLYLLGCIFTIG